MNTPTHAVVVAIGADGHTAALHFGVAEALRRRRPLHLVHVLQSPVGRVYAGIYNDMLDLAKRTLDAALATAHRLAGGEIPVTAELVDDGWVVDDLVRGTEHASVLVMQHRALSRLTRVFSGSVVAGTAGRAHVPVISVPETWEHSGTTKGFVTAAVQDPTEAPGLLRAAFDEAGSRGARLVVLHAWWLSSGYDAVAVDDAARAEKAALFRAELEPALAPLEAAHQDVRVSLDVRHAPPIEAVLDAGDVSDLLVLGRRHHLLPAGSHLGPIARVALARSTAPVLVAPEQTNDREEGHQGSS
ncbi:MAG TPA: universal stress protein [Nocardioides sp.]|uniref:universal stress protein n=1 Tax=uncultured Nocardioides sp. TaxID=198441 RepID=UPI00260CCD2C|nr:universal stress protein [uncultured Nocardioides sp.]HRD60113.1 universal stress protein [Nocardioides sp.]HRI98020.1 universal stress protein [Nocardioides sp.]